MFGKVLEGRLGYFRGKLKELWGDCEKKGYQTHREASKGKSATCSETKKEA